MFSPHRLARDAIRLGQDDRCPARVTVRLSGSKPAGCVLPAAAGERPEDGFLYLRGRMKDMIIRGGNNVHASDVESVLYEHPAVREAAVAGVAHRVLGEDVGAWVVLVADAAADAEELRAFCATRLSDYKVPRRWTFVDSLPRNATGKVVKDLLPGRDAPA